VTGWHRIGPDAALAVWATAALPLAVRALAATDQPLRCGGTWAVGLDLLPNAGDGSVAGVRLPWQVLGLGPANLHAAQLSAVYPGYPQPSAVESEAAFRFRLTRDAAHLDGLLAIGPAKRRMIKEPHAWILGLPLNEASPDAAPLVVWEGSHRIMQAALKTALAGHPPQNWGEVDITEAYQAARAKVFSTCRRVELPARPGEATLLHRHLIHGVAPWGPGASAPTEGRIVAYFRPVMAAVADWVLA
jgi:Phytanoyl-CoA dioxygenase (PhyH)